MVTNKGKNRMYDIWTYISFDARNMQYIDWKSNELPFFEYLNEYCQSGQSYEIKLPPRAILGFKILEIFSVEN